MASSINGTRYFNPAIHGIVFIDITLNGTLSIPLSQVPAAKSFAEAWVICKNPTTGEAAANQSAHAAVAEDGQSLSVYGWQATGAANAADADATVACIFNRK